MPGIGSAEETQFHVDGHTKARLLGQAFPDNSLFNQLTGSSAKDFESDLRLNFEADNGPWSAQAAYQLFVLYGDRIEYSRDILPSVGLAFDRLPSDRLRLFDLTNVLRDEGKFATVHRLDRLSFGYTGEKTVLRVGRQAISWGNGFFFAPMDIVNPFDPAAIDTEYKTGDDMVYGQYLQDNGNDWQFVSVWRRDENGNTGQDVNSNALKYHAFVAEQELDVLLAQHFEDEVLAAGGITGWGGALVRGDVVLTHTDLDTYVSAVANLSYSWVWGGKNISGVFEYFYNGMGLREEDYSDLANEPDLISRLRRGELFTLGRHYLAGGLSIEMTPLIMLAPTLFVNLGDNSGLAQVVGQYDFKQDWQFLLALNLPFGSAGTEFGGLDTGVEGKQFSRGPGLFAQFAFYF